ncbi:unnamed protein product [Heligmosomoides polygyrus]|uniref:ZP domain-containing protein n=1 Tax=Heligmosomoides polygyrus TaxID=6339 RepID=A0A183F4I1_HELPZ|nr:unnamed protein product [Heligmosomoides polygyrus]
MGSGPAVGCDASAFRFRLPPLFFNRRNCSYQRLIRPGKTRMTYSSIVVVLDVDVFLPSVASSAGRGPILGRSNLLAGYSPAVDFRQRYAITPPTRPPPAPAPP